MRILWMTLLALTPTWACSCIGTTTPCSSAGGGSVIFVARVLVDSGEYPGTGAAKVVIEEALQHVPAGLREVEIGTMAGTSCYRRLQAGERYVIITDGSGPSFAVGGCNPSFSLRGNEHILDAMRAAIKNEPATLVGTVRKSSGAYSNEGGVEGASVTAEGNGVRRQTMSDGLGRFSIVGLDPGTYKLEISKQGFTPDTDYNNRWSGGMAPNPATNKIEPVKEEPGSVFVPKNACTIKDLAMWPAGAIKGIVRSREGVPLRNITVQAFTLDKKNERESKPVRTALTDTEGRYMVQPLPAGSYAIGVNGKLYDDEDVYPPTFYADGKTVYISEGGSEDGVNLLLPPARIAAQLKVFVLGPDGRPYGGAHIRLDTPQGQQRWYTRDTSNQDGEITVPAYVGERYSVRASNFVTVDHKIVELQGVTPIELVDPNQFVTISLHEVKKVEIPQLTIK